MPPHRPIVYVVRTRWAPTRPARIYKVGKTSEHVFRPRMQTIARNLGIPIEVVWELEVPTLSMALDLEQMIRSRIGYAVPGSLIENMREYILMPDDAAIQTLRRARTVEEVLEFVTFGDPELCRLFRRRHSAEGRLSRREAVDVLTRREAPPLSCRSQQRDPPPRVGQKRASLPYHLAVGGACPPRRHKTS